jgi:acyl-CoA synthetase (AMP-forming)/AMP-acid ligase II
VVDELIDGRWQKVFKNRPKTVQEVLERAVAKYPEREGFVSGNTRLTFKQFSDLANNVALTLQKDFKVMKGDRIAILMGTGIEFAVSFFGLTKIGGIAVPLNTRFKGEELTYEINNSESSILIMDQEFWEVVGPYRSQFFSVKYIFVNGGEIPQGTLPFSMLTEEKKGEIKDVLVKEDDILMIMYTSGTTGHPKGAMQFHRGVIQACMLIDDVFQSRPESDRMLCVLPMFHSTGIIMSCIGAILMKIPCIYMRSYKTKDVLEIMEKEKITLMVHVPAVFGLIINYPDFEKYDLSHFRAALIGGSPKSPELIKLIRKKMPHIQLFEGFGMTETHTMDCILTNEEIDQNLHTVGRCVPIEEVKVVDEQGRECLPDIPGELLFRGSKVISSYWRNPTETARVIQDGWLHTGDVAKIDQRGYVTIMDRIKDMINRGGEKIYSLEVENVLYRHPKILEAAVIGVPDKVFGEEVKAVIVVKEGEELTVEEIKGHCSKYLADYKVPKYIEFVSALPRNPGGKVMKDLLRMKFTLM